MDEQAIENQARIFLYDLMNSRHEHGFHADDTWNLSLVSITDRAQIEKDYYPAIAVKIIPEILLQVYVEVKAKLKQALNKEEVLLDVKTVLNSDLKYIVAYNPKRIRT
ncbi:hypothetical protein GCM10023149_13500 [Mucilaginibacter gynuensis]|uniref:Uncharacterized protein n=1 Tax=Mucilaginibacter gynuensis TaxID=1302236 RepID=A0ABP8G3W8_9SPHI